MTSVRTFFLMLAGVALLLLLQQPLCQAAHPQAHRASGSDSCCLYAGSVSPAKVLDVALDSGGRPPAVPLVLAYLAAAALFAAGAVRFASAVPPPRSFYARSSRILR